MIDAALWKPLYEFTQYLPPGVAEAADWSILIQQSARLSQFVPPLQAACRGRRGLMKAVDISISVRRDMKPPVHPMGLARINLDFDRENVLASRMAPELLQRNALQIDLVDKRMHSLTRPRSIEWF